VRAALDNRTFNGICGNRVPDCDPKQVPVLRITQDRGSLRSHTMGLADRLGKYTCN
jgi:hypothetical protein